MHICYQKNVYLQMLIKTETKRRITFIVINYNP